MPAATNRADLIAVTVKEYAKLTVLLDSIDVALAKRQFDDASIKDVIGHRAHWIDLFFGWYDAGQAGDTPDVPAKGYKWNQLKEYNAELRLAQAGFDWATVCEMLATRHQRLIALLEGQSEAQLYDGPMPGGGSKWTTGRWAEAAGASHYRSAAKFVRACLRAA